TEPGLALQLEPGPQLHARLGIHSDPSGALLARPEPGLESARLNTITRVQRAGSCGSGEHNGCGRHLLMAGFALARTARRRASGIRRRLELALRFHFASR